jgi:hypothetical protein
VVSSLKFIIEVLNYSTSECACIFRKGVYWVINLKRSLKESLIQSESYSYKKRKSGHSEKPP